MTTNPMFLYDFCKIGQIGPKCKSLQFEYPCILQYLLFPWIFKIRATF